MKHIKLFDAIEYSHFYINGINFNRKAVRTARKYGKPLVGTSDIHFISQLGHTYTMIDAEKNAGAVIEAIKKGNLRVITRALPLKTFLGVLLWSTRETLKAVLGLK